MRCDAVKQGEMHRWKLFQFLKGCFSMFDCKNVDTPTVEIHANNHSLKCVRSCKYLGVTNDNELT